MSKASHGQEKTNPQLHPAQQGEKAAHSAEHKGPPTKSKGHNPLPGGCLSHGCKANAKRFNFCDEHYDHFKFGLIKKTGEPVSDYEKKIEHYLAHKAKRGAQRVA